MQNSLQNLLEDLRNDADFGVADDSFVASTREKILNLETQKPASNTRSMADFVLRIPYELTDMVARPVAFAALLMVMVLGGWITSVNASLDTLPGDALYGVKIVSEKAQLSLASSKTKGKLHAEFATRRLNEINTLVQSDSTDKDELVAIALKGFETQIAGVESSLKSVENDDSVELARAIEESVGELEEALDTAGDLGDGETHEAIASSVEVVDENKDQAVGVLIESADESVASARELSRQYTNSLRDIQTRSSILLDRIDRVEAAIEALDADIEFDAGALRAQLNQIDLSDSMDFAAIEVYDRAFDMLSEEKAVVRDAADALLHVEIMLTNPDELADEVNETEEIEPVGGSDLTINEEADAPDVE